MPPQRLAHPSLPAKRTVGLFRADVWPGADGLFSGIEGICTMILVLAVILGLALGLARNGPGAFQITSLQLRGLWLAPLALALQIPLLRTPFGRVEEIVVPQVLFLLSHVFLLAFVWLNRRYDGSLLIGLGVIYNLAVILANGGLMPITPETVVRINPGASLDQASVGYHYGFSKDVILPREATRLWLMSDVLVLTPPFPWPTAFSLGDLLLALGIVGILQAARQEPRAARLAAEHDSQAVSRVHGPRRQSSQYQNAKEVAERRFVR